MAPENHGHGRGSAPYRHSDWTSHLWAMSKLGQFKTTRECACSPLLSLTLLNSVELVEATLPVFATAPSNARRSAGRSPRNQPSEGLRLCQSRNGATNSTIAEESFPGDVTQPSQVSTREQPKEPEPTT